MDNSVFEVVVQGTLGADLIAALDGYTVSADGRGRSRIVGPVRDQVRLIGLLSMFDDLHIEVISVNPVDASPQ
ncbi:hypothetical protein [Microbacterium invictum]|uniref:hypothetical protein n=1 Tax=Microbacterium invictum TaxID=515415 RepID=UPI0016230A5B|nr:hypothetical protein [Microbacterium invictum]